MGFTVFVLIWASIAKIEQVVPAKGQLKPKGAVKEIKSPVNGVVKEVFVEDGEKVKEGQLLMIMDSTASKAELESLQKVRNTTQQENKFYRALMERPLDVNTVESIIKTLNIPKEVALLARNRTELVVENQLFRVQLGASPLGVNLNAEQLARLSAANAELDSRAAAARLEIAQLEKQLSQNFVKLADTKAQLATDKMVLQQIKNRNELVIAQTEESLAIDQKILSSVQPLLEEGALAMVQFERQKQQVSDRLKDLIDQKANGRIEYENQRQQVETRIATISELQEEQKRLNLDIAQAREELINTTSATEKQIREQIAANEKRIAEIDSQLNKIIVDNDKRIAELNSDISRTEVTIGYQEIRSPAAGTVFDLRAFSGFVPQPSQTEPMVKIVPDDYLIAEVDISNQDIGFVREGMHADVRVDTFPFSRFGDVKGEVVSIGSDALEPDQTYNYFRFPAKVSLDQNYLVINGDEFPLHSGMSVTVNIKVKENRTVLSLFTDMFTRKVETLKQVH